METKGARLRRATERAKTDPKPTAPYTFDIKPPQLLPGVVPKDATAPVLAMDYSQYEFAQMLYPGGGFPGFAYLSQLATRAEFRAFASTLSTEITREWIEFTSKQDDDDNATEKIKQIEDEFKRLNIRGVIQKAAEQDCYFGRAQLFIDIQGAKRDKPLILDPRTVAIGSLNSVTAIEAIWTTPNMYNALDPAAPDFYKPSSWFMLGQHVHASRLLTIVTRPLPDILKPAFNFAGMSLSQLAEPYVDNWLRTRQSVSDLINNFSTTVLATSMDQVLQGNDDGADVIARADLFTAMRSNKGLMLLDKNTEELVQINTPLSGLHELQAQSQEQMCSVSRMPAIILTGISPGGLNASSDSEIRAFYDWIAATQESFYRAPLEIILKTVQLSLFGEIDPDIGFDFVPLYQMTTKELSEIRKADGETAVAYINAGVIDPSEERERLANDPNSGYQGLDLSVEIVPPAPPTPPGFPGGENDPAETDTDDDPFKPAQDADFKEADHPRADNGQFGSGGGGKSSPKNTVKLKQGNVAISKPLGFTKDPVWKAYKIDHPNFPAGSFVDGNKITIKNGKIVGMTPALAKQLKIDTEGDAQGLTERNQARKDADEAAAEAIRKQAGFMGGALGIADALRDGRITQEQAQERFDALKAELNGGGGKSSPKKAFKKGGKDEHGFERAPGLDESERLVEQSFYDRILGDTDGLIADYHADNGNVIDPDLVKGLDPNFADNYDLARAVHEPSSHLAKIIYQRALDKKAAEGDTSPTLFSAGGGGSGKSRTRPVAEAALGADPNGLFYDSTLSNFSSATKRIDAALNTTKGDVGIVYTNTPIETALKFNASRGRTVSIDTLLHAHVGASDTIRKLAEHYADNPRVNIAVINNGANGVAAGDIADVPKYEPFNVRDTLVREAKAMLDSGEIDQNKYNLLIK